MDELKTALKIDRTIDLPQQAARKRFSIPFWLVLAGFLLLIALRDIIGIHIPRTLYTAYLAVGFFLVKEDMDLALLLSVVPFLTKVNFNEITLVFILVYVFRRFQKLSLPAKVLPFLMVLAIELMDVLLTSGDLMQYFRFAVVMLISMLILINPMPKEMVATLLRCYALAVLYVQLDVAYNTFTHISLQRFFDRNFRFGYINQGEIEFGSTQITAFNPNMLGFFSAAAVYCVFILIYTRRMRLILGAPLFVTILFFGLLTQSRSMLVALIVFAVLVFALSIRSPKRAVYSVLLAILAFLILLMLLQGPLAGLYDRYLSRFGEEDVTNGRIEIWLRLFTEQVKDPLKLFFGFGIRSYADAAGEGSSAHNMIVEVLLSWGIFGLVMQFAWIINSIKIQIGSVRQKREKRIPLIYFVPLIAFLVHGMSEHIYTVNVFTIVLSVIMLAIRMADFDDIRQNSREERKKLREEKKEARLQRRRERLRARTPL